MDIRIQAAVDHLSILNFSLSTSTDIFFSLGFVRDGGKDVLDENVFEMLVPTARFIFDNAYVECVQFPPSCSEFFSFLHTPAGIHIIALLTPDAETFRLKLQSRGIDIEDLDRVVRKNFDSGENKGTIVMLLAPLPYEVIPRTHVAFLQHMTRELIYQPTRYPHPNGVTTLDCISICCETEQEAEHIRSELSELCTLAENNTCPGGSRCIRLLDPDTIKKEYGITCHPGGSVFAALTFGLSDFSHLKKWLNTSHIPYTESKERILVNNTKDLGIALEFRRKQ